MSKFNFFKDNKWIIIRILFYGIMIFLSRFNGETISRVSNIDWVAFCLIIPVTVLFFTFSLKLGATISNGLKQGSLFSSLKKDWYLPTFKSLPLDLTNPPSWLFEAGNYFVAKGLGAIIHCRYYDWTVFWVISIYFGIGLSMYLSLYLSTKLIKWKYNGLVK
ncbi:hypothetical protein [Spirochaeta cellobiosiphila]|uniref:hypothetical protein n=1 Tax=Spirochaeta cellobiosiphila TaxID=504483 RepID=UPI00048DA990|nr:hypothetical protein [Spirochaeta cellobiosiphila]